MAVGCPLFSRAPEINDAAVAGKVHVLVRIGLARLFFLLEEVKDGGGGLFSTSNSPPMIRFSISEQPQLIRGDRDLIVVQTYSRPSALLHTECMPYPLA